MSVGLLSSDSFKGLDRTQNGTPLDLGVEPPDTIAAAGPNSIVEAVNSAFAIFDKTGVPLAPPQAFSDLFGIPQSDLISDVFVTFDEQAGRFLLGTLQTHDDMDPAQQKSFIDFAVSDNAQPTTASDFSEKHQLDVTEFNSTTNQFLWGDFPRLGWNADGYVFSLNMFTFPTNQATFDHVQLITIDKASVLDANPATLTAVRGIDRGNRDFTMVPATMHGSAPGDPMWFVEESGVPFVPPEAQGASDSPSGALNTLRTTLRLVQMSNVLSSSPAFSDFTVAVPGYGAIEAPLQPGGTSPVPQDIDTRLLSAALRGNRLVATQSIGTGLHALARWYEFDLSGALPTLKQSGDICRGNRTDTYYPSIDIAANGDLGMTFLESSANEQMSMYVTGQTPADPLGVMETPVLVKAGESTYQGMRAGDFSGISIDPANPNTFWAANEYSSLAIATVNWGTWLAAFSVNGSDPGSTTSRTRCLVAQIYEDLLQRPVDLSGLVSWSMLLDQGLSPIQIVAAIEQSPEYRTLEVQNLYHALLGRAADASGLNTYVSFLQAGGTVEQVETTLLTSPEFLQSRGAETDSGFLQALYTTVLGRNIDPPGQQFFSQILAAGVSRSLVATLVVNSVEAEQNQVQSYYQRFLRRSADPSGLKGLVDELHRGVQALQPIYVDDRGGPVIRDETIIASILGSDEYLAWV
jgi:hypothetical protein